MGQLSNSKKLGIGSISLVLSIFGAMFSFTAWSGKEMGEHILNLIGITFPVGIISLIILFISLAIGYKYKDDYLAKSGTTISVIFILLILVLTLTSSLF